MREVPTGVWDVAHAENGILHRKVFPLDLCSTQPLRKKRSEKKFSEDEQAG
jgi:hypothetical protein